MQTHVYSFPKRDTICTTLCFVLIMKFNYLQTFSFKIRNFLCYPKIVLGSYYKLNPMTVMGGSGQNGRMHQERRSSPPTHE